MIEEAFKLLCVMGLSNERYARILPEMVHLVQSTNL
jgi:hypothetical protein